MTGSTENQSGRNQSITGFAGKALRGAAIAALTVSSLTIGLSASADAGEEYMVSYSHTELTSAKGAADVHARIVKAAKNYCPTYSQIRSQAEVKLCVDGVVEDLVSKVDHPTLTSLHESGSAISVAESEATKVRDRS